jgi:hypothetical protein
VPTHLPPPGETNVDQLVEIVKVTVPEIEIGIRC